MTKKKNDPKCVLILILAALIWGASFAFQSEGGNVVGPFSFAWGRSAITSLCLGAVTLYRDKKGLSVKTDTPEQKRILIISGIICGVCFYLTALCQQLGMKLGTAAGKAGFITTCYVVLVPVFGIFLKNRCGRNVWIAVVMTVVGLYFLCITGSFGFEISDVIVLGAAIACTIQILVINRYGDGLDSIKLSFIQFFTAFLLGTVPMVIGELIPMGFDSWLSSINTRAAVVSLLYTGFLSGACGYTLQIAGQRGCEPATASILMSLESVFSVLAGWLLLNQLLSGRELAGCALIFAAVILAQLPGKKEKNPA